MAPVAFEFGAFRVDVRDRTVTRDGRLVDLTPKSALLLVALLEGGGRVVGREALDARVWNDANVGLGSLPFQIHLLRRALGDDGESQRIIQTVPRMGYRIAVPIRLVGAAEANPDAASFVPPTAPGATPAAPAGPVPWQRSITALAASIALCLVATTAMWRTVAPPRVAGIHQLTRDGQPKEGPLQIDGHRLLYRGLGQSVEAVSLAGGQGAEATALPPGFKTLDFSPKRAEYLATSVRPEDRWTLWAIPKGALPPRRIGSASCEDASWSPSANWIACTTSDALVVFDGDGAAARVLSRPATGRPLWPRWSPNGGEIGFTVERRANRTVTRSLWIVAADGRGARELVAGWSSDIARCCASWSPDGRYLAFGSEDGQRRDLWLQRLDGAGRTAEAPVRLTTGPLMYSAPVWERDGRLLALGVANGGEMVRYDARSRGFVPFLGGLSATWLSFSRDGNWMAYSSFPDGALWRARADGSDRLRLTPPMDVQGTSWSPDGQRIAFRSITNAGVASLHVIARDGGTPEPIALPSASIGVPTWSPDGRRLATGDVPGIYGQPEGTEAVRLYDMTSGRWSTVPGSAGLWTARWSPDGRYIAALTIRGQQLRLYDTASGQWRAVDADHINSPTWSRDGRHIYYDTEGNTLSLRRVRVPDGRIDILANLTGFSRAAYWWSGVSLDDNPIVLRHVGAVEVYALDLNDE
jgi:Tol biopolymer transport system component/DNA-binding winged helix-turn-helix (wHTH) protein